MAQSETVLVTGGTGFIGSYTAKELLDHGHDVVAYDLSTDTRILEKLGIADDVEIRRGDITDSTDVYRAIRETGTTRIVHLAALLTTTARENPRLAIDVNVRGTNTIFEAARTFSDQVERVAWASSAAVFAPPANYDDGWVTEDDLVYPDTLYGASKEFNEHQAKVYFEDHDLSHVALRPTVAYGPYRETGGSAFLANIIEKPALGEPFSVEYGDQVIDWQHVEDIAQAFRSRGVHAGRGPRPARLQRSGHRGDDSGGRRDGRENHARRRPRGVRRGRTPVDPEARHDRDSGGFGLRTALRLGERLPLVHQRSSGGERTGNGLRDN